MGRVGASSLSGCRMAAMRRLLGLLVCLPVACYSQGCPSHAPYYDRRTDMCYYHYGKGCDIGGAGSCCSNSVCERRTPWAPVCTERGYCHPRSYQPTGPGCRKERGRVKCDIVPSAASACPQTRVCGPLTHAAVAKPRKSTWGGGGLSYADKCAMVGGCGGGYR